MSADTDKQRSDNWSFRRKMFVTTMGFCGLVILFLIFFGDDTRLNETIALGCFGLAAAIIGFYTGFATWDDTRFYLSNQKMENLPTQPSGSNRDIDSKKELLNEQK